MTRRYKARFYRAKQAVKINRMSIRKAAFMYHVARSTLHHRIIAEKVQRLPANLGRKYALTNDEEKVVIGLILYYADCGIPWTRTHVQDALQLFIEIYSTIAECSFHL